MNLLPGFSGYRYALPKGIAVALVVVLFLALVANMVWWFDKGLIFHDEGWSLMHFREGINTVDYSNWHRVGRFLYSENLFLTRMTTFCGVAFSAFILGLTFAPFIGKSATRWVLALLFVVFQLFLSAPVMFIPNYGTLNIIAVNLSTAGLLFYLKTAKLSLQLAGLFFSGFFTGTLPFIQITSSLLLPLLLLVQFLIGKTATRSRDLTVLAIGMLSYPVLYFMMVQSPADFLAKFLEATKHLSMDEDYGLFGLVKWNAKLLLHFAGLPAAIVILALLKAGICSGTGFRLFLSLILGILAGIQLYLDVTFPFSQFPVTLWYCLLFISIWMAREHLNRDRSALVLVIFFTTLPYFASLGTVVRFQLKAISYFPHIAMAILLVLSWGRLTLIKAWFSFLTMAAVLTFFSFNFRIGWAGYRITDQTEAWSLSDVNSKLRLDPARVASLDHLSPYLRGKSGVIVSHENLWGYVWLLNAKPQYLHFRFNPEYFKHFVGLNGTQKLYSTTFLELKWKPFSKEFLEWLEEAQRDGWKLKCVEVERFTIYTFVKNQISTKSWNCRR
jgi:hypothetical protein